MQEELPLLLVEVTFDLRLQLVFKLKNLYFLDKIFKECIASVADTVYFEQFLLVLDFNVGI